jgi:hypothetical protein
MPGYAGKENAVKDLLGNWWYQDPTTASWYIWNGQDWQRIAGAAPRITPHQSKPATKKHPSWSCLLTAVSSCLIALIVLSGITLVAYQFIPGYYIYPGNGDIVQIYKIGGIGFLGVLIGIFMIHAGFANLISLNRAAKGEKVRGSKILGCSTILNGLGQLLFGLLFFSAGLSMIALVFYQEMLPWLGF